MLLDWKTTAIVCSVICAFVILAMTKVIPQDVVSVGISGILGWVGGVFVDRQRKIPPENEKDERLQ